MACLRSGVGRQQAYSDAAIQTCLTMKVLFGMALRQTTGCVESLPRLVGLDWTAPDFSTPSRRQQTLAVNIPYPGSKGPLPLLVGSRGIKVEGEGVLPRPQARRPQTARVWRKLHLGVDEETLRSEPSLARQAICAANQPRRETTGGLSGDAPVLPDLLSQIPPTEQIGSITAECAYERLHRARHPYHG